MIIYLKNERMDGSTAGGWKNKQTHQRTEKRRNKLLMQEPSDKRQRDRMRKRGKERTNAHMPVKDSKQTNILSHLCAFPIYAVVQLLVVVV